jgi:hypothetical protein
MPVYPTNEPIEGLPAACPELEGRKQAVVRDQARVLSQSEMAFGLEERSAGDVQETRKIPL